MSKQMGNFILLNEAVRGHREVELGGKVKVIGWCADATRAALASGGDGLDDANFAIDLADTTILRLSTELKNAEEVMALPADHAASSPDAAKERFFRDAFLAKLDDAVAQADAAYASLRFRDAFKFSFYATLDARDEYRKACQLLGVAPNKAALVRFLTVLAVTASPILSHFCDYLWRFVLGLPGSVHKASWPALVLGAEERSRALALSKFLSGVEVRARQAIEKHRKAATKAAAAGASVAKSLTFIVAESVPAYHKATVDFIRATVPDPLQTSGRIESGDLMKLVAAHLKSKPEFARDVKMAMAVAAETFDDATSRGVAAYETTSSFDEVAFIDSQAEYIVKALVANGDAVERVSARLVQAGDKNAENARPGRPLIVVA